MKGKRAFSVLGNIAIVNFSDGTNEKEKKEFAREILGKNKSIRTVLEKSGRFSGELRVQKTKHLLGEKTKEVLYKENGCEFRFKHFYFILLRNSFSIIGNFNNYHII